jgi:protein TonB
MTAAAVRPDLFNHLFATQRNHPDRRDVAATVLSVVLHGSAAAALVWASASITRPEPADEPAPIPIVFAAPEFHSETPARGGGATSSGPAIGAPIFTPPVVDPDLPISDPSPEPWVPPGELARGGPPPVTHGAGSGTDPEQRGGFEVSKELPQLLNPAEVQRALERNYPGILRDAGIGGRVVLWLLIDENGRVIDADVRESSGQEAFDSAAARVAEIMRFSPGKNRESRVKVWVSLPVLFRTK